MELSELKKRVKEFDSKAGFDKTEFSELIRMFEEELDVLKSNSKNKEVIDHQLTDLLILIMQFSYRYDADLDKEISHWFDSSKKYLG